MLRVLALLCSLALMLAPLGPAKAGPACTMVAVTQFHSAHGSDHQMPAHGHPTQACKQLCAVVAILASAEPVGVLSVLVLPSLRPVARLLDSRLSDPSERPPKGLV